MHSMFCRRPGGNQRMEYRFWGIIPDMAPSGRIICVCKVNYLFCDVTIIVIIYYAISSRCRTTLTTFMGVICNVASSAIWRQRNFFIAGLPQMWSNRLLSGRSSSAVTSYSYITPVSGQLANYLSLITKTSCFSFRLVFNHLMINDFAMQLF